MQSATESFDKIQYWLRLQITVIIKQTSKRRCSLDISGLTDIVFHLIQICSTLLCERYTSISFTSLTFLICSSWMHMCRSPMVYLVRLASWCLKCEVLLAPCLTSWQLGLDEPAHRWIKEIGSINNDRFLNKIGRDPVILIPVRFSWYYFIANVKLIKLMNIRQNSQ